MKFIREIELVKFNGEVELVNICVSVFQVLSLVKNCANIILGYLGKLYKLLVNKEILDIASNTCKLDT